MGISIVKGWRIISLILALALAVSIGFNVYQSINPNGNSSQNSEGGGLKFTFTWGPEVQNITEGEFRLEVEFIIEDENMTVIIKANDNEFHAADTVAIGFASRTGVADPYVISAYNWAEAAYIGKLNGQWGIARTYCFGHPANQTILFDESGYTFIIRFPARNGFGGIVDPLDVLQRGEHNTFVVGFQEFYPHRLNSGVAVFAEAQFYLP
ncbi:MAG: hypothetical protein QXL91_05240 [Candidatus Bathyarchaeia archaeon]